MQREELENKAIELYLKGLSFRNVAIKLGLKSLNTIKNVLLKRKFDECYNIC